MKVNLSDFDGNYAKPAYLSDFICHQREVTAPSTPQCPYCGCVPHESLGQCSAIKRIEYYPDGSIKSVEKR